tara:strand:+ start:30 stop:374 length:345 start_codon:yes stop_codon:yes gene_type:complete
MIKYLLVTLLYLSTYENLLGKERNSTVCYKRGVEVILPYEFGISKIKKKLTKTSNKLKNELRNYKKIFENNFYGLNLYETSGCSKARLSEYLECLIETDGEDCRIYYTQMRLVD